MYDFEYSLHDHTTELFFLIEKMRIQAPTIKSKTE